MFSLMLQRLRKRPDIPFSDEENSRFLPWIMATMAALGTLLLCTGLSVHHWTGGQWETSSAITIAIPAASADALKSDDRTALINQIQQVSGVSSARFLKRDEVLAMVEPWLGASKAVSSLPIPEVIEVQPQPDSTGIDSEALQTRIHDALPEAQVNSPQQWAKDYLLLQHVLQATLFTLAGLILLGMLSVIVCAAKVSLALHRPTVQLLHRIGADDAYVAQQFQRNAQALCARGVLPAIALAGAAYAMFSIFIASLQATLLPELSFGWPHVLLLLLLALGSLRVAGMAARIAVRRELARSV